MNPMVFMEIEVTPMTPIAANWTDVNGLHQGGQSCGIGYTIAWQRGALDKEGRNGAFLIEVLEAVRSQIQYYQDSKFVCEENATALQHIDLALAALNSRRDRRKDQNILGTHVIDP
jgi:hypothetical protein